MPPTVTCDARLPPSRRWPSASTTWLPTVLPNRIIQALGIASVLLMVPVAQPSARYAPEGFESVIVNVSLPSSWASSSTGTDTLLCVSPAAKLSVPLVAV